MFSVVIPTYNRADYLPNVLESLVNQKFKNFEVIVCDDGSTDNTELVIENFKTKLNLKYIKDANWGGPARPRNIGIKNAIYDWVCFLDSDDLWYPDKLQKCYEVIQENKLVDVIFHKYEVLYSDGTKGGYLGGFVPSNKPSGNLNKLIYNGNKIVLSSLVVRKECLKKVEGFSEDLQKIGIEDYHLMIKLSRQNYYFFLLDECLGDYLVLDNSLSSNGLKQVDKVKEMLGEVNAEGDFNKKRIYALGAYMTGNYHLSMNNYKKAREYYSISFKNSALSHIGFKSVLKFVKTLL